MIYDASKHEKLYQTWELRCLALSWIDDRNDSTLADNDNIDKLYAKSIQLQTQNSYGFVMPSHMFYKCVEDDFLTNYDGSGVFLDWEGDRQGYVDCNTEWLKDRIKKFPFVMWFNK